MFTFIKERLFQPIDTNYLNHSYSQLGEDKLIELFMANRENGMYVDVGAHHPIYLSNSYWAYKKGWNGINIEPNFDIKSEFEKIRPRDITLNCGVSDKNDEMTYYYYKSGELNTFDIEDVEKRTEKPLGTIKVPVRRLDDIFTEYNVGHIDFMNIDVEGFEMKVLISNDWDKYSPDYILVEQFVPSVRDLENHEVTKFLESKGYICISKCHITVVYVHKSCWQEYIDNYLK